MSMNKKQTAVFHELEAALRAARALRFTEAIEPDVPVPHNSGMTRGFLFSAHVGGSPCVEKACSNAVHHSFGRDDKTTSQGACRLYSTRLLALRAMRHEVELKCAHILADIDAQIEKEKEKCGVNSVAE